MAANSPVLLATFDSFRGGEYGETSFTLAKADQITGQNVLVSTDGGAYPRPPCETLNINVGTSWTTYFPRAIGYNHRNDRAWIATESAGAISIRGVDYSTPGAETTYAGTMVDPTSGNAPLDYVDDGSDRTYFASYDAGVYVVEHGAATVTLIAGPPASPEPRCIAWYGERLVVGGTPSGAATGSGNTQSEVNRLWFSAANNANSWPTGNFLDIGRSGDHIVSLNVVGDTLVVCMEDGDLYTINGVLGVNEYVRRVTGTTHRGWELDPVAVTNSQRGMLWMSRKSAQGIPHPISFDGGNIVEHDKQRGWTERSNGKRQAAGAGHYLDDVSFFAPDGDALIYRDGIWTRHSIGALSSRSDIDTRCFVSRADSTILHSIALTGATVGLRSFHFSWNLVGDTPFIGSTDGAVLDFYDGAAGTDYASTCWFRTAERLDSQGRRIVIRHIDVEFTAYDTGATVTYLDQFTVGILAHGVYEAAEGTGLAPTNLTAFGSWSDDPNSYTTGGTRKVKRFSGQSHPCRSFQVQFSAMRGVKIHRVSVYGDVQPAIGG